MISSLDCPVCQVPPEDKPIYQCVNGHLIWELLLGRRCKSDDDASKIGFGHVGRVWPLGPRGDIKSKL
jgi:hypothetical protein